MIKLLHAAKRDEINERLIATLVQANEPPEYFSEYLVRFLEPILNERGQSVVEQRFGEKGTRFLWLKFKDEDQVSGLLHFSRRQMEPVFYAWAAERDMTNPLRDHLGRSWTNCHEHWDESFLELKDISEFALALSPIDLKGP